MFIPLHGENIMQIKKNLGVLDRGLRAGISLLMIYFGFYSDYFVTDTVTRILLGGMGVGLLGVAIIGFCPMYAMIGFSTASCEVESSH